MIAILAASLTWISDQFDVDAMLNRNREICSFERPREADLQNLRIWIDNKASVARDETAYLSQPKDLMTFLSPRDDAMARLTPVTERLVGAVFRVLRKVSLGDLNLVLYS